MSDLLEQLNLDLTQEERDILYEFTRAREVMEVLGMPGWLHIQDLIDTKLNTLEEVHLKTKNVTPEALWAQHVAVQFVHRFVEAIKSQLRSTGDWLKDPQAIQDMINRANAPNPLDLEGEMPNPLNPLPPEN